MRWPSFINGSYESQAWTADQEVTINLFPERMESQGAVSQWTLYPTPGVTLITTALASPGRAHFSIFGREFAVQGTSFNEINVSGTVTVRGAVALGASPATISSNGDGGGELFITSGGNGYIFDLGTNILTQIAALNGKATMGDSLDGYFLALDGSASKLYISDLLDGLTWDPTQFAQRTIAPDPWKAMRVNGRYIWLLGEQTSEVWYDTGASPFPFAPYPSGLIYFGIVAPFSAAVGDGTITWLGASRTGDRFVLSASGFTPEVVSDLPRQYIFSQYGTVADAEAEIINLYGHVFYRLTFPAEDVTWYRDATTQKWGMWVTWISEENRFSALRPRWHAMAFGEHRILDAQTGAIYMIDSSVATDVDNRPIRRVRKAPALVAEDERIFYASFQLDMQPGIGTSTGQGANPQVMARFSRDGGQTWGPEIMASAGPIGSYATRVIWNRVGSARRLVVEISFTDPCPFRLVDAYLALGQAIRALRGQQRAG